MRSATSAEPLSITSSFTSNPKSVAARVFALDEPWRGNFLAYIAAQMGRNGNEPSEEELAAWLAEDPVLCRHVRLLLYVWTKR